MLRTFARPLAVIVATGAIAAPAASAMVPPQDDSLSAAASSPAPEIVTVDSSSGFDVGDAAIGAGAAVAVLLVGAGGTFAVQRSRHSHLPPVASA